MPDQGTRSEAQVVAIGSPWGDDRLGWVAARLLRRSRTMNQWADRVTLDILDRPGVRLVEELARTRHLLLIDAIRSEAAPPGYLHIVRDSGAMLPDDNLSSHGFGVAQAFALARSLNCLPTSWAIFGIEIGAQGNSRVLSPEVREAIPRLVVALERELFSRFGLPRQHNKTR